MHGVLCLSIASIVAHCLSCEDKFIIELHSEFCSTSWLLSYQVCLCLLNLRTILYIAGCFVRLGQWFVIVFTVATLLLQFWYTFFLIQLPYGHPITSCSKQLILKWAAVSVKNWLTFLHFSKLCHSDVYSYSLDEFLSSTSFKTLSKRFTGCAG